KPMPLPSSTAFTTLTGCDGLAVEQALIATSWAPPSDTALAGAIPSVANAKTARPAVIVANLRLMSHLLTMLGKAGSPRLVLEMAGGPGRHCAPRHSAGPTRKRSASGAGPRLCRNQNHIAPKSRTNLECNRKRRPRPRSGPRNTTRTPTGTASEISALDRVLGLLKPMQSCPEPR